MKYVKSLVFQRMQTSSIPFNVSKEKIKLNHLNIKNNRGI